MGDEIILFSNVFRRLHCGEFVTSRTIPTDFKIRLPVKTGFDYFYREMKFINIVFLMCHYLCFDFYLTVCTQLNVKLNV